MTIEAKEHYEHISIIMEIAAFFFVTVDLYGKERLNHLRERIKHLTDDDFKTKTNVIFKKIAVGLAVILALTYIYIRFYVVYRLGGAPNKSWFEYGSIISGIAVLVFGIIIFATTKALDVLLKIFEDNLLKMGLLIIYIVRKIVSFFPIEGMMLTIGALLFVIAKLVLYFAV